MDIERIETSNPREYRGKLRCSKPLNLITPTSCYCDCCRHYVDVSPKMTIDELNIQFILKRKVGICWSYAATQKLFIKFLKNNENCSQFAIYHYHIQIDLIISKRKQSQMLLISNNVDESWYFICEQYTLLRSYARSPPGFLFSVVVQKTEKCSIYPIPGFNELYDDSSLTDFELRGEDGSIHVHKNILAINSPVLKAFLESNDNWLEKNWYKFSETKVSTLQHLKDYIYLGKLPEEGLLDFRRFASCYMMEDLEKVCELKILEGITAENALDIAEFAMANKMTRLFLGFLKKVKDGVIKIDEMS